LHKLINKIFVSSDDINILNIAKNYNVELIKRPKKLATDKSPEILSWKHAIKFVDRLSLDFDKMLILPTTSPLRNSSDVTKALNLLNNKNDIVITVCESIKNPWFNMVKKNKNNFYEIVNKQNTKPYSRRQDVPKVYDITTVCYVSKPEYIKRCNSLFDGKVSAYKIPRERSIDIDTKLEFDIAEYLLKKNQ